MTAPSPALVAVGRLLERGVDLDVLLAALVDEVVEHLGADRGTLYLMDPHRQQIFSKAAHLPELEEIRLDVGQGVAGAVAASGRLENLTTPSRDTRFDASIDARTGYVTRSMLVAPIRDGEGTILGVLQLLNKRTGDFTTADEQRLTVLCAQVADVIAKTSLYPELTARPQGSGLRPIDYRYNFIVGSSTAMRQVYALVDKAAATDATVLLTGASGTGKGLVARAIHRNSKRRDAPFVTVDCTTLPPALIENELFGHERGAYTGAERALPGKFEIAAGGTVFIDEIGELPLELQSKLLRVLQEREVERIGGRKPIAVNVRLIVATHRNLDRMVANGRMRADLYYRIRVLPIRLPPLAERGAEDIQRLAEHFRALYSRKHGRPVSGFSRMAWARLLAHSWPGNVRELENCIESAVVLADGPSINAEQLALPTLPTAAPAPAGATDLHRPLAAVEHSYIRAVLADCDGNQSDAARRLGISRNTLARKLRTDHGG